MRPRQENNKEFNFQTLTRVHRQSWCTFPVCPTRKCSNPETDIEFGPTHDFCKRGKLQISFRRNNFLTRAPRTPRDLRWSEERERDDLMTKIRQIDKR